MDRIETQAVQFANLLRAFTPLILAGIRNEVIQDDQMGFGFKLHGFYKDGSVTVFVISDGKCADEPVYRVKGRYDDNLLEIYPSEDPCQELIQLNADRFRYWNSVKPEFDAFDPTWLPLLIQAGLVKEVATYQLA